jgi:hypothetical protein
MTGQKGSSMRLLSGSLPPLLLVLVLLVMGCNTVSPDECWVNTSGGFGGSGPIPIGAGVGATSGDYADPPRGPLDNGGAPYNPCVDPETPEKPSPKSTCEVPDPAAEGAISWSCSEACSSKCPPPGMSFITVNFSPSEFPFVTTVQDDGTGKAGGYQEAKVNLEFIRIIASTGLEAKWYCPFTIKMPLRTEFMGKIPASLAATMSVDVTESVARDMLKSKVPPGIFCIQFVPAVESAFGTKYPLSGAKATK